MPSIRLNRAVVTEQPHGFQSQASDRVNIRTAPDVILPSNRRPRGVFGLLADSKFGPVFWGRIMASSGAWIHGLVAAIVMFEATNSTLMVALVSVAQFAPQLILSPWSGGIADRGNAPRQILVGRVLCALGSGLLAIWFVVFGDPQNPAEAWPLLASSLVVGVGFVVGGPAMHSIVPRLIRAGEMPTAMALSSVPMTFSRITGPILGAFVAAHFGAASAFFLACVLHFIFILLLMIARLPAGSGPQTNIDYSVREGARYIRRDRPLLFMLAAVGAVALGAEPAVTLAPAIAHQVAGDTGLVGLLTAAFGAGSALGLILLQLLSRRVPTANLTSRGLWVMALGLVSLAAADQTWVALIGFSIVGFGFSSSLTCITTMIQQRSPEFLRGRIMAMWLFCFLGARPLAATLDGVLTDTVSLAFALGFSAAVLGLSALMSRPKLLSRPPPAPIS